MGWDADSRAVSSLLGDLLMVLLALLLVLSLAAAFYGVFDLRKPSPTTQVRTPAPTNEPGTEMTIEFAHRSGETVRVSNLKFIVEAGGESVRLTGFPVADTNVRSATTTGNESLLAAGTNTTGGSLSEMTDADPRTWTAGESLLFDLNTSNIPSGATVTVTLVHTKSQAILDETTFEQPTAAETGTGGDAVSAPTTASIHTTDSDFQNATKRDDFSIEGSGAGASLDYTYRSGGLDLVFVDDAEPFPIKFYDTETNEIVNLTAGTGAIGGAADMDHDGDLDVFYRDEGTDELQYVDGMGRTTSMGVTTSLAGPIQDLDGDGDLDATYSNYNLQYIDSQGNTVQLDPTPDSIGGSGDIDGDGDLDVTYERSFVHELGYVDGANNYVTTSVTVSDIGPVGDFDGDGKQEIIYIDRNSNLKYAHMTASGSVDRTTTLVSSDANFTAPNAIADIDGDGDLDVTYSNGTTTLKYVDLSGNVQSTGIGTVSGGPVGQIGGDPDASYTSTNHTLTNQSSAFVNMTVENTTVDVTWETYNNSTNTWRTLASNTYTTTGNYTVSFDATSQPVRVHIAVEAQTRNATTEIHAEGTRQ